jgi:hypothetical protein
VAAAVLKAILATITPLNDIFVNLVRGAALTLTDLQHGAVPTLDVYTGPSILLAGFIYVWSSLLGLRQPPTDILGHDYFAATPEGFVLVFLTKLPSLTFDLLTGVLIARILASTPGSESHARNGFALWFLNPIPTFMVEMWGTIDVVPAFLTLLSLHLISLRKNIVSGIAFASAVLLRIFPLLLLPVHSLVSSKNGQRKLIEFLATVAVLLISAFSAAYVAIGRNFDALSLAVVERFYYLRLLGFPISGGINPFDSPILLGLFLFPLQLYVSLKLWCRFSPLSAALAMILTLLTAAFHEPYHFLWVVPFLVIDAAANKSRRLHLAAILVAWFFWTLAYADLSSSGNAFFFIAPFNSTLDEAATALYGLLPVFAVIQIPLVSIFYALKAGYLLRINLAMIRQHSTDYTFSTRGLYMTSMEPT